MTASLSLQTGMKSVITGTYVAEQRARAVYDLVSPASSAGVKFPKQQSKKRGKGYRSYEPAKCTMLPALMSLEPLLGDKNGRPDSTHATLPSIHGDSNKVAPHYAFCKPSNDALSQWLLPPPCSTNRSGVEILETSPVPEYLWHILLLDKTFDVASNTVHHVSECLRLELDLDERVALQKVEATVLEKVAKLVTFESPKEAYRKVDRLLDHGLVVRISKGIASLKDAPPNVPKRKYAEVFKKHKLSGQKDRSTAKLPPMMQAASASTSFAWRKRREPISVISEDPVSDWFNSEHERCSEDAEFSLHFNEDEFFEEHVGRKASTFKQVINKHRGTLHIDEKSPKMTIPNVLELLGSKKKEMAAPTETVARENKMVDTDMKEACKMLRIFVFGKVGNESATTSRERNKIFYEPVGAQHEVLQLYGIWKKLDIDQSGRVDIEEFRAFAVNHMKEHMQNRCVGDTIASQVTVPSRLTPRQRAAGVADHKTFVTKLCDKLALQLLGKKSSFSFEDMMKVVWPCAELSDLKLMKTWCKDFAVQATKTRVQTPPILPEEELDGLASVFSHFDEDGSGGISLEELVGTGLIYADQLESYLAEWGKLENGGLTLLQFCEMMCPVGFRAHSKAQTAKLENGSNVYFDPRVNSWREEDVDENF